MRAHARTHAADARHAPPVGRLSTSRATRALAGPQAQRGRLSSRRGRRRGRRGRRCGQKVDCSEGGESSGDGDCGAKAASSAPSEDMKAQDVKCTPQEHGQWRAGVRAARRRLGCEARARGEPAQGPPCMVRMVDGLLEDCAHAKRLAQRLRRRRALQAPAHGLCARRADAQTSAKGAGAGLRRAAAHRRARAPTDARRERRRWLTPGTWSF